MSEGNTTHDLQVLLDRFNAGDAEAKKELVTRAYGRMILIGRRLLNDYPRVRADKETTDVVHEAFERLDRALADVHPGSVRDFLGLVALQTRRVLLDTVRKQLGTGATRRPVKVGLSGGKEGEEGKGNVVDPPDPSPPPELTVLLKELLEAVEKLPDDEREVVDLLFFHGLTQIEAAEILGVHEATVKRRWSRARIKLAQWIGTDA